MMRGLLGLLLLSVFIFLTSCSESLTGDEGKIIGRWEEAGKTFNKNDTANFSVWYRFREKESADSYMGPFAYKLDTARKILTTSIVTVGTDGHTRHQQPFFERTYVIRKDTLILTYTSRTSGKELKTILVRKK